MSMEEERMTRVTKYCSGKAPDVGGGAHNKFIKNVYPNGVGIDFYPQEGADFVHHDATYLPFEDSSFDTVTLIAVGGHIPMHLRKKEFKEFARVLK